MMKKSTYSSFFKTNKKAVEFFKEMENTPMITQIALPEFLALKDKSPLKEKNLFKTFEKKSFLCENFLDMPDKFIYFIDKSGIFKIMSLIEMDDIVSIFEGFLISEES